MTKLWALAALLILTVSPVNAIDINPYIKFLIRQESRRQGVDENFCLAVAHIESRRGSQEFRTGLIGHGRKSYYAPFNIHPDYLKIKGWRVDRLEENIYRGVHALRGGFKSLRRYNASYNSAYAGAIKQAMRKYQCELSMKPSTK